ncbi:hypothetical protein Hanom_Chr08g00732761 [Helianthus anomalus]
MFMLSHTFVLPYNQKKDVGYEIARHVNLFCDFYNRFWPLCARSSILMKLCYVSASSDILIVHILVYLWSVTFMEFFRCIEYIVNFILHILAYLWSVTFLFFSYVEYIINKYISVY